MPNNILYACILFVSIMTLGAGCHPQISNVESDQASTYPTFVPPNQSDSWEDLTFTAPNKWRDMLDIGTTSTFRIATEARFFSQSPILDTTVDDAGTCDRVTYRHGGEIRIRMEDYLGDHGDVTEGSAIARTTTTTLDGVTAVRHEYQDPCTKNQSSVDYHLMWNGTYYVISLASASQDIDMLLPVFEDFVDSIRLIRTPTLRFGQLLFYTKHATQETAWIDILP